MGLDLDELLVFVSK